LINSFGLVAKTQVEGGLFKLRLLHQFLLSAWYSEASILHGGDNVSPGIIEEG
jgi:hypothetical protein